MTILFNNRSRDRYASLAVSRVWRLAELRQAIALVVGAGALGNEACKNLVMMGVRHVSVVDRDMVEVSNLTRSVFFRESDHGRPKAIVLAERARALNPDVDVWPIVGPVAGSIGLGLVRRADLILSCLDNRQARLDLNRMCHKVGKPWVDGSMEDLEGDVTVYVPGSGPCYECTLTRTDREILATATSCKHVALRAAAAGKVPTTSTMGSIVAALQVQEAIKLHQGDLRGSLAGRRLVINAWLNDYYPIAAARKDDCLGHVTFGDITEVPAWRAETTTPAQLLARFRQETGTDGTLRLGFDLVVGLRCYACKRDVTWDTARRSPITPELAGCPACGQLAEPVVIHRVSAGDAHTDWALARLGVSPLDILEIRSASCVRWYELTGDLAHLPPALGESRLAAQP